MWVAGITINIPICQNLAMRWKVLPVGRVIWGDERGRGDNDGQTLVDDMRGQRLVDTWEAIVEEVEVNGL